ncbi:MAG: TIM barrel protein [Bacteroidota bacterium]
MSASSRRSFIQLSSAVLAGLGLPVAAAANRVESTQVELRDGSLTLPNNPLVLFDNFHSGNRRAYSWKAKLNAARAAGCDGFQIVMVDPDSDYWKDLMDMVPAYDFRSWGFHWNTGAVIDEKAHLLEEEIDKMQRVIAALGRSPLRPFISFAIKGGGELFGGTIHESGSAKAEDRHWERAARIVAAFDRACRAANIEGALYPHTHWLCDTPASQRKILADAEADWVQPAFCSHHWYAHKNNEELDELLLDPVMAKTNYVVLTNGRKSGDWFPATRFDRGEIDMAWLLAKLYAFGYQGPIASQGWGIGGDPYVTAKAFVDGVRGLRERFIRQPDLWPLL